MSNRANELYDQAVAFQAKQLASAIDDAVLDAVIFGSGSITVSTDDKTGDVSITNHCLEDMRVEIEE